MKQCQHRETVLNRVSAYIVEHPFERLSLQGVADGCGLSLWQLRYNFGNASHVFRAVAVQLIDKISRRLETPAETSGQVLDAIHSYAGFLAELLRSAEYRDFLFLLLRNGKYHEWLESAYDRRIVSKACRQLETIIARAGEKRNLSVALKPGAARRFYTQLETELVLTSLLPAHRGHTPVDLEEFLRAAAKQAFEATYLFDWRTPSAASSHPPWSGSV